MAGIAACIIARDEERALPRCLGSIRPWVEQICLVDTGSRDATVKIAQSFGAEIAHLAWEDDFSRARNASLDMAKEPWILVIDADEELDQGTGPALRAVATSSEMAFLLSRDDLRADGPAERIAIARILRKHPQLRFQRPVHESIMESLFGLGAPAPTDSGVRLLHYGYLPEALRERDKHGRNLALLRRRCLDEPSDLYSVFKWAVTLPANAESEKLRAFGAAMDLAEALPQGAAAELPFLATLYDAYAAFWGYRGELTRAIEVADRGRGRHPEAAHLDFRRGELARWAGDFATAERLLGDAIARPRASSIRGDRSSELAARSSASLLAIALDAGRPLGELVDAEARATPAVRVGELRLALFAGRAAAASEGLAPLLESHFHDDDVKLLGGELAWAQRDFDTAHAVWSLTHAETEAGHRARVWLALLALLRRQNAQAPEAPRDVAAAAMARLLATLNGDVLALDRSFVPAAVERWIDRWLAELRAAGAGRIADDYRARAGSS